MALIDTIRAAASAGGSVIADEQVILPPQTEVIAKTAAANRSRTAGKPAPAQLAPVKPAPAKLAATNPAPVTHKKPVASTPGKTDIVLKKLHLAKGATIAQLIEATGWQAHSVRGFLSAVIRKKLGLTLVSEIGKGGIRRYRIVGDADVDRNSRAG